MAGINSIRKADERKAQAEAVRRAPAGTAITPKYIYDEGQKILAENETKKAEQGNTQKTESLYEKTQRHAAFAENVFKPVQQNTAVPEDNRTTQQKYDDAKKAYDSYLASDEYNQKLNRIGKRLMRDDTKTRELNATVEHYRKQLQAEEDQRVMAADLKELESWSEEDRNNLDRYIAERDQHAYNALNPTLDTQFDTYNLNPIVEKYGVGKVRQMAESLQRSQNAETTAKAEETAKDTANERPWIGGIVGSLASVGANLAGAYTGPLGYVVEAGQRTGRYSTLDPNNIGNLPSVYGQTVRSEVAQNIQGEEENTNWLRKLAALGYQGVMSAADSGARMLASGGSAGISAALASSGAFSNGLRQYSQQGASPEQAVAMALTSAGLEYITEKLPTEKVLKMFQKGNTKGAVREVLKQAFLVEPTSEEVNLFAGVAAEALILGDKNSKSQQVGELIANGMSYDEAQAQVYKELWNEALQTYAVSAFSGLASSGGAAIIGNAVNGNQQQETPQQDAPADSEALVTEQPQNFVEATGEQLAQQMPKPEEPAPLTEGQQHMENAVATTIQQGAEESSIKDQIRNNQDALNKLEPVASIITPKGFSEMTKTERKNWVIKKLRPTNYEVDRKGFGIIKFAEKQLKSAFNYLKRGSVEEAAFEALPYVLENGTEIATHPKHKGREYGTVTIAAPVVINGTRGNMAVIVKQTTDNFYKVHRILTPDGAVFDLSEKTNEAGPSLAGESPETGSLATPINPASDSIIQSADMDVKGTGAAEQNFSGKAQYQDLLYEGNVQRDRPGDVRPMEVPKKDTYNRNVSKFVGNAYGAAVTSDKMANEIESLAQEGALGFDRRGNQDALNDAAKEIEKRGTSSVRNQITRNIANGKIVDGDIEKAMLLYANLANKNGIRAQESAAEIMVDLTTMAHMTGRNLQLFKLLRRMTPEGQLMAINQTVQRNVENMKRKGLVKEDYQAQLDPELLHEYEQAAKERENAETEEQRQEAEETMQETEAAIFAAAAAKMPATFKAKWDAWRYMSMLGNAKTQVRNLVGNLAFMPYKTAKDKMAAVFEKALPKEQRTKAIGTDFGLLSWAKADAKSTDVKNALKYSAKLGDDVTSAQFAEDRQVFNSKALDSVRKFVEKVPQAGDMVFKNDYYARSLASFLKARGYNAEAINSGKASETVLAEARGYAIQEAMKATFNDSNAFSDAIASIGRKNTDNVWSKVLNVAAEGILPFRRTPANIAVRFAEYSPAGLAKGVWDMATKVRRGDLSAAAAIDQISAGLTGTGVMALGFFLAKGIAGVKITGSGTDEDEKRQGHQDYAVEFSIDGQEYSYKIDWAAPANLPLFVGANIYKAMEEAGADTEVSTFTSILHSMGTMFEPMLSLSCMSSLNDLVEGVRYAPEGEALYSVAADIATSYFMQGIPALARQTYQATQENKQSTFANSEDKAVRELQKIGAQIPFVGAEFQTDKVNAWGETETTESGWERALNAYFNPGTHKKISDDPVELELNRLKEAQVENVSPPTTDKTVSYTDTTGQKHNDMRLTEEQYQTLATTQGQTAKKLLDKLVKSKDYKVLTDTQKAATVNAVYEYAAEAGKKAALSDYYSNAAGWISGAESDPVNAVIRKGTQSVLESVVNNTVAAITKGWEVTEASKKDMDSAFDSFEKLSEENRQALLDTITGDTLKYLEIRSGGVNTGDYLDVVEDVKKLTPETGYENVRENQKREAIANSDLDSKTIDVIMKAYMTDYDPEDDSPDKTELRYEYARKELGLSPKQYAKAYTVQANGGKKAEKIEAWMEQGYSEGEATVLYYLFAGSGSNAIDVVSWYNAQ